ncbi:MAG: CPBP family intramembrane metalloprotease [Oscillospiraceae bacterium]|nr:CPBP family intramembrane metalloprotease [Oscillospiraceae bacterium]
METSAKSNTLKITVIVYAILFYAIWALYEFFGKAILGSMIADDDLLELVEEVIKNLVWTLPAMLLVWHFRDEVLVKLKDMFTTKVNWLHYLPVFVLFVVFNIGLNLFWSHSLHIDPKLSIVQIIVLLSTGLTEEMVFRGWLLNATFSQEKNRQWIAIAVNAVMFLAIHFPIWIMKGRFVSTFTSGSFLVILALGVIFGVSFVKSKNILVPISLHIFWNLIVGLFE